MKFESPFGSTRAAFGNASLPYKRTPRVIDRNSLFFILLTGGHTAALAAWGRARVGAASGRAGEGREVGVPVARAGGRKVGARRREGSRGVSEERSGEGSRRMPEPTRPCGGVASARARTGGREVRALLEMHNEPLRPTFAVWLASREAAMRWREGGHGAAHAGGRRIEDRGGAEHVGGRDGGRGRRGPGQSSARWREGGHSRAAPMGGLVEEDERKKDRNGTCVTSGRWVIFVTKSR